MTRTLLKSNTLTAAVTALCCLCLDSLWWLPVCLLAIGLYLIAMAWWCICCERIEESSVPSSGYQPYKLIGARDKPRAHQPPRNS